MAEVGSAFVSLMPSAKGFGRASERQIGPEVKTSGGRMGHLMGGAMALAGGAALAGGFAAAKFLGSSIGEAREAQKVGALSAAVIKSTGGAAHVTAKQVGNLANALSLKTGIDDETIQSGENMLLTFKNVRNEAGKGNKIFDQSTRTLVDLSAAMGTEPKQAAIQLGKALNDPVKGITALTRVGVTFTDQQKKTITSLVDSGHTMQAQKIILKELNSEFGGAAASQATAGDKFKVAWQNFEETVGTALLPLLDKLLGSLSGVVTFLSSRVGPAFSKVGDFAGRLKDAFNIFGGGSGSIDGKLDRFADALDYAFGNTGKLAEPLGVVFGQVAAGASLMSSKVIPAVKQMAASWAQNFLPVAKAAATVFVTQVLPAVSRLVGFLASRLVPVFVQVAHIISTQVIPIIASFARFFYAEIVPVIVKVAGQVAHNLKPAFDSIVNALQKNFLPTASKVLAKLHEWQPTIQRVISILVQLVGKLIVFQSAILGKVIPAIVRVAVVFISTFYKAAGRVIGIVVQIITKLVELGRKFFEAGQKVGEFAAKVAQKVGEVIHTISGLAGKVTSAVSNFGSLLLHAGEALIQGLISGIENKLGELKSKLSEVTHLIPKLKGPPATDAKLLFGNGQLIMGGLIDGIESGKNDLASTLGALTRSIPRSPSLAFAGGAAGGSSATGALVHIEQMITHDPHAAARALRREQDKALALAGMP